MSSKIIDDASNLYDQLSEKRNHFLHKIEYQSLMFVDLDSNNKRFHARLQSTNDATIDRILRHKMSDIIFKNQCNISKIFEHLMTWATIRKRIAKNHLSTSICVFDHDNINIFFDWNEKHKYVENWWSIVWCIEHTLNSTIRYMKTRYDYASTLKTTNEHYETSW
jgi:hypothetical protein